MKRMLTLIEGFRPFNFPKQILTCRCIVYQLTTAMSHKAIASAGSPLCFQAKY